MSDDDAPDVAQRVRERRHGRPPRLGRAGAAPAGSAARRRARARAAGARGALGALRVGRQRQRVGRRARPRDHRFQAGLAPLWSARSSPAPILRRTLRLAMVPTAG